MMDLIEQNLVGHLEQIAIPPHAIKNPTGHKKVSAYIQVALAQSGLAIQEHRFPFEGKTFSNWIATPPKDPKDLPLLILGAHYDTVADCPGADDNASGVAVLLETARLYMKTRRDGGKPPQSYSLQFVFFDLEEFDLDGSKAYVKWLKVRKKAVKGMFSLEMLGTVRHRTGTQKYPKGLSAFYPSRGDFIALIGSLRNPFFFWKTLRRFRRVKGLKSQGLIVPGTGTLVPDVRRSDHAPFWDAGFPAILITDTSFLRNPFYHSRRDTKEKLDTAFMARITHALLETISSF